jgi:hypothetical protein
MPKVEVVIGSIQTALSGVRITPQNERELGDAVQRLFDQGLGFKPAALGGAPKYTREHRLSANDRLDFFVGGKVAVELKIKGSLSDLLRQVDRYLSRDEIQAVVVVSTMRRLSALPSMLRGKPLRCVYVGGAL